jgi:hypothetical protein
MGALLYYGIVFLLIFISYKIATKKILSAERWVLIIFLILLGSSMLGIRYVISDWYTYYTQYNQVSNNEQVMVVNEPLWMQLETLFTSIGAPYYVFFTFVYALYFSLILLSVRKVDRQLLPLVSFFVFLTIGSLSNIMRQSLAFALILPSIFYLEKKKILFVVITIIAFFIHYSAIVWLPLIFLSKTKIAVKPYIQCLIYIACSFVISDVISSFIISQVSVLQYMGLYTTFDESGLSSTEYSTGLGKIFTAFETLVIIYYSNYLKSYNVLLKQIYPYYFICTCAYASLGKFAFIIGRIFLYGMQLQLLILPAILYILRNRLGKSLLMNIIIFTHILLFIYSCFKEFAPGIIPLRFIWENSENLIYKYYLVTPV